MPFLLITIGIVILASAFKGTTAQLGQQFVQDLKGSAGNVGYVAWVSSILAVGALGYYAPAQKFSRAFMFLIISGMVIANKGVFAQINSALKNPVEPQTNTGTQTASAASSGATASTNTATSLLSSEESNVANNVTHLATFFG